MAVPLLQDNEHRGDDYASIFSANPKTVLLRLRGPRFNRLSGYLISVSSAR